VTKEEKFYKIDTSSLSLFDATLKVNALTFL